MKTPRLDEALAKLKEQEGAQMEPEDTANLVERLVADGSTTIQFWKHKRSGDIYAVAVDETGHVLGVSDVLYYRQIELHPTAGYFRTYLDNVEWFNENADNFVLYEPEKH